jgi:hypothetical protein
MDGGIASLIFQLSRTPRFSSPLHHPPAESRWLLEKKIFLFRELVVFDDFGIALK